MTPEERQILTIFVDRGRKISKHSIFAPNAQRHRYKLCAQSGGDVHTELTKPNEEATISLTTLVRPCWMQGDTIYFRRVYNIVWREVASSSQQVKDCAASVLDAFKCLEEKTAISLTINDVKLTPEQIVRTYFHGDIFHTDLDKNHDLEQLRQSPLGNLLEFEFANFIFELGRLIIFFADLIDQLLLEGPGLRPGTQAVAASETDHAV